MRTNSGPQGPSAEHKHKHSPQLPRQLTNKDTETKVVEIRKQSPRNRKTNESEHNKTLNVETLTNQITKVEGQNPVAILITGDIERITNKLPHIRIKPITSNPEHNNTKKTTTPHQNNTEHTEDNQRPRTSEVSNRLKSKEHTNVRRTENNPIVNTKIDHTQKSNIERQMMHLELMTRHARHPSNPKKHT